MATDSKGLALTVVSISGFQLMNLWNSNAPSLAELRVADPNNKEIRQQLVDAEIMVGGTALLLGGSVSLMTHDNTALVIMATLFGSVAIWHHLVLRSAN
jgi:hypothetical protein